MIRNICPTCGNKTIEYKHGLNTTLISVLSKLHKAGGRANSASLNLTYNERANAQKLKYWQLIDTNNNGYWSITNIGIDFVNGLISIYKYAYTINNHISRYSGPKIEYKNVVDKVQKKNEYTTKVNKSLDREMESSNG